MKIKTPEQIAMEWGQKKGFDSLTEVKLTPIEEPKPSSPEEAEAWARGSKYLDDLIEQAFELLREEAVEGLRLNPDDTIAQNKMLRYKQYLNAKAQKNPNGLILSKKVKTKLSDKKTATWKSTRNYGWVLRTNRSCAANDHVEVRKKGGIVEVFRLTVQLFDDKTWRGVRVEG
jgi:hypothetical protein